MRWAWDLPFSPLLEEAGCGQIRSGRGAVLFRLVFHFLVIIELRSYCGGGDVVLQIVAKIIV